METVYRAQLSECRKISFDAYSFCFDRINLPADRLLCAGEHAYDCRGALKKIDMLFRMPLKLFKNACFR
jgi:hypothetical protein